MHRPPSDQPEFDIYDVEEWLQEKISKATIELNDCIEKELPFPAVRTWLESQIGPNLQSQDQEQVQHLWSRLILKKWLEIAISSFKNSLQSDMNVEQFREKLKELEVSNFWELRSLGDNSFQRLIDNSRDDLIESHLGETLVQFTHKCQSFLIERNQQVPFEFQFLKTFIEVLGEKADERFLESYEQILTSDGDHDVKFQRFIEQSRDQENLATLARHFLDEGDRVGSEKKRKFYLSKDFIEIIELYFKKRTQEVYQFEGVTILEICGSAFAISQLTLPDEGFDELHLIGHLSIKLDRDLCFPGVNVYIETPRLLITQKVAINTTGQDHPHRYEETAADGADGCDGYAGGSAGNIVINSPKIDDLTNLIVIANGGKGSDGQHGGNGQDGIQGEGITAAELEHKFPPASVWWRSSRPKYIEQILAEIGKDFQKFRKSWWTANTVNEWWRWFNGIRETPDVFPDFSTLQSACQNVSFYIEAELNSGKVVTFAWECGTLTTFCQSYLLVEGSEGTVGGTGGAPGKGGQGGFAGSFQINGQEQDDVEGKRKDGNFGHNGRQGQKGRDGKNGWDIGWMDFPITNTLGFGVWPKRYGESERVKLELKPNVSSKSHLVQCPYRKACHQPAYMDIREVEIGPLRHKEMERSFYKQRALQHHAVAVRKNNVHSHNGVFLQRGVKFDSTIKKTMKMIEQKQTTIQGLISARPQRSNQVLNSFFNHQTTRQVEYSPIDGNKPPRQRIVFKSSLPGLPAIKRIGEKCEELIGKNALGAIIPQKFLDKIANYSLKKVSKAEKSENLQKFLKFFAESMTLGEKLDEIFDNLRQVKGNAWRRILRWFVLESDDYLQNQIIQDDQSIQKINKARNEYSKLLARQKRRMNCFEESLKKIDKRCEEIGVTESLKNYFKSQKPSMESKAFLELFAQINQLNIKFFSRNIDGNFVLKETFNPLGNQSLQIYIDEQGESHELVYDEGLNELETVRAQKTSYYKTIRTISSFCQTEKIEEIITSGAHMWLFQNERTTQILDTFDQVATIENILKTVNDNLIAGQLDLLVLLFPPMRTVIKALEKCLQAEGLLIDIREVNFLLNTAIQMSQRSDYAVEIILWIVWAHAQKNWFAECTILRLENYFERPIPEEICSKLKQLEDKVLLFLITEQLDSEVEKKFLFTQLEDLMKMLQSDSISVPVFGLPLENWPLAFRLNIWEKRLKDMHDWKGNPAELERVLHYCSTIEVLYSFELLSDLFTFLSNKKNERSRGDLVKLLHALFNEQILLKKPFSKVLQQLHNGIEIRDYAQLLDIIGNDGKLSEKTREDLRKVEETLEDMKKNSEKFESFTEEKIVAWRQEYARLKEAQIKRVDAAQTLAYEPKDGLLAGEPGNLPPLSEILVVIDQAIWLKESFHLRDTQKIAILMFCQNRCEAATRLLEQVSTGEGKSLIVVALAIIKALSGEKVDIITSSSVLARRDADSFVGLYELFNVAVGHNCSESQVERTESYQLNQVIYGEIGNFQRDYLCDRFYGQNIIGSRNHQNVIVDEEDSMLLDKGSNVLYLSHHIAGFDKLEAVLIFIWQLVNHPEEKEHESLMETEFIRQKVIDNLYERITREDLRRIEFKEMAESQIDRLWNELVDNKVINAKGRLLTKPIVSEQIQALLTVEPENKPRLEFLLNQALKKRCLARVPNFLVGFVENHLTRWIENAKSALWMPTNHDYTVDTDKTGMRNDLHPNVTILDRDTGTDQITSQWDEGLHQFLQLKHGCKMSPMSLKAIFISNVSYFRKYKNLFGLTGTLGSIGEIGLLRELFEVEYVTIPTARGRQFVDEKPVICNDERAWLERIVEEVRNYSIKRSILVICETVRTVELIVSQLATFIKKENLFVYKREYESFTVANSSLAPVRVIVATNLAGRGTDIKISEELSKAGGLHVCLTFLPNNKRIEQQAFGRAARAGEPGSGRLVILGSPYYDNLLPELQMIRMREQRDNLDVLRISGLKSNYNDKILLEEEAFKAFHKLYDSYQSQAKAEPMHKENYLENLLDQWAFWLDRNKEPKSNTIAEFISNAEKFPPEETFLLTPHVVRLAKSYCATKNYTLALSLLGKIILEEPHFAEVAHYYKAYALTKKHVKRLKSSPILVEEVISELKTSKRMFEELINAQLQYSAIVNQMKKSFEQVGLIQVNSYEQQKQSIVYLYNLFIWSIDQAVGSAVMESSFVETNIDSMLSASIYRCFLENDVLAPICVAKNFERNKLLEKICNDYGISLAEMRKFLAQNFLNRSATAKDHVAITGSLKAKFCLSNRDEFWEDLSINGWLLESKTYVIVNLKELCERFSFALKPGCFEALTKVNIEKSMKGFLLKTPELFDQLPENSVIFEKEAFKSELRQAGINLEKVFETELFIELERAQINPEMINFYFTSFDEMTLDSFKNVSIADPDAQDILDVLEEKRVLERKVDPNGAKYRLTANDANFELPAHLKSYEEATHALLQYSFFYRIALNRIQQQIVEDTWPIKIPIEHKPHQALFWDLVEAQILLSVSVKRHTEGKVKVRDVLKEYYPKSFLEIQFTQLLANDIDGTQARLQDIWKQLLLQKHLISEKLTIGSLYTIGSERTAFEEDPLNCNALKDYLNGQYLLRKGDLDNVIQIILDRHNGLIETLSLPDAYLKSIRETIGQGILEEVGHFEMNGLGDQICFNEMPYSDKMQLGCSMIVCKGVLQIAIGVYVQYCTEMQTLGSALVSEGIGDLMFAVSAVRTGYFSWSTYTKYKLQAIATTAILGGVAAWRAQGAPVSHFGLRSAPQGGVFSRISSFGTGMWAATAQKTKVETRQLIAKITKNTIKGLTFGFVGTESSRLVNNNFRTVCEKSAQQILDWMGDIGEHQVFDLINQMYDRFGPVQAAETLKAQLQKVLQKSDFENRFTLVLRNIGATLLTDLKANYMQANEKWSAVTLASMGITLMKSYNDVKYLRASLLNDLNQNLKSILSNDAIHSGSSYSSLLYEEKRAIFHKNCCSRIQEELRAQVGAMILQEFVEPLVQRGSHYLTTQIGQQIQKHYKAYYYRGQLREFKKQKEEFETKMKASISSENDEIQKSIDREFRQNLRHLKDKVTDPRLYVRIAEKLGEMDAQCMEAFVSILASKIDVKKDGYVIQVEHESGYSYRCECGNLSNAKVIKLRVSDDRNWVGANDELVNTGFNTMLAALESRIPELSMRRDELQNEIFKKLQNDRSIGDLIRDGYHRMIGQTLTYPSRYIRGREFEQRLVSRDELSAKRQLIEESWKTGKEFPVREELSKLVTIAREYVERRITAYMTNVGEEAANQGLRDAILEFAEEFLDRSEKDKQRHQWMTTVRISPKSKTKQICAPSVLRLRVHMNPSNLGVYQSPIKVSCTVLQRPEWCKNIVKEIDGDFLIDEHLDLEEKKKFQLKRFEYLDLALIPQKLLINNSSDDGFETANRRQSII